jgi:tetratricopeptide (TPR) repeat protein
MKKMLKRIALIFFGVIIVTVLGTYLFIRATTPTGISYDPADEGYCEAYGIVFDTTQVDAIYVYPEIILADPDAFLSSDPASIRLANLRDVYNEPLNMKRWVRQIERISDLPMDKREQELSFRLSNEVLAGEETFCRIVVPHVLSYLPQDVDIGVTYYQAALDPLEVGFTDRGGIVTEVSHPVYGATEKLFGQGSAAIYNNMTHELFHHGYIDSALWQVEDPVENGALRELMRNLQNEGMAVNAGYRIREIYPSALRYVDPLINFKPLYRYLIGRMNKVFFDGAETKTDVELYQDLARLKRGQAIYFVSGYMAVRIEDELGKEALAATAKTGPRAFILAYNSVAEKGMEIHFVEPAVRAGSDYRNLRTAALNGDLARVRDILQDIQSGETPLLDFEAEGHLVHITGRILLRNGDLDLAEEVFQTLITFDPQVAAGYIGLGDVYVQRGETAAAIEVYERAVELGSNDFWMLMQLAELQNDD